MDFEATFAKALGEVLLRTANSWVYNCDSGCFQSICEKESWTVDEKILIIYQPHKSMREYDDMYATVFFKRIDKKPITKKTLTCEKVSIIKKLFMDSLEDILQKSENKWTHAIKKDFDKLVQIKDPFRIESGTARFTFEIRGAVDGCCGDRWEPHRLEAFINNLERGWDNAVQASENASKNFLSSEMDEDFKRKLKYGIID